ncbi:MOSC domain protein beta barrel domain protein [[Leptolyngbya] sp. PCC 7376]|uniref:MOSC domain-containing protein n=1 Tax=[Leptolyngbya] sp. PCC 7376 TaxID=111781 RepID=UPI00029F2274|nr:MOSC domain-containing protein [[Leptolyngbya] sp. PCC 7376]AFY37535.1 MOSC domain protein beta barrel domain protein [[Leptolyngbya] sp. PCC 7376]
MVTVAELWIYPVKSCRGITLNEAQVTHKGFAGDRQWMIVDAAGKFITQRSHPQLAKVRIQLDDDDLTLDFERQPTLKIPVQQTGDLLPVTVWRNQTEATDQGEHAAEWFSRILQIPCRLVRQSPEHIRPINPKYALWENQPVSFADGYPILLTNTASLQQLSGKVGELIPMNRFRPNLVVAGDRPFAEDNWQNFKINELEFVVAKPCERCVVTTTDQNTGDRHPSQEPLRTLRKFRYQPKKGILFGINLMPKNEGFIKVGQALNDET